MDIEAEFKKEYGEYLADFETMSVDTEHTNKPPLCSDTHHKFYNFDKIVKKKYPKKHPASPDMLILKKDKVYCVEFKNLTKKKANKNKQIIQNKARQGKEVLLKIFEDLSINCENLTFIFCVVYKNPPKNNRKYAGNIESRVTHFGLAQYIIDERIIQFDLKQFKGYFDDIVTNDVDFFREQFIKKIDSKLPC